jgi:hypothetical protein
MCQLPSARSWLLLMMRPHQLGAAAAAFTFQIAGLLAQTS